MLSLANIQHPKAHRNMFTSNKAIKGRKGILNRQIYKGITAEECVGGGRRENVLLSKCIIFVTCSQIKSSVVSLTYKYKTRQL